MEAVEVAMDVPAANAPALELPDEDWFPEPVDVEESELIPKADEKDAPSPPPLPVEVPPVEVDGELTSELPPELESPLESLSAAIATVLSIRKIPDIIKNIFSYL